MPFQLLLAALISQVAALDNGLALTPPMGWRSWNCFHGEVNDSAIRATIDAITDRSRTVDGKPTSLADLGFDSVGIDDGALASIADAGQISQSEYTSHRILHSREIG